MLSTAENLGPSEEADAEFAKELAKMVVDNSGESRRVDKKTAQALWDSAVIPSGLKKKRTDIADQDGAEDNKGTAKNVMNFTVLSKRGNKQTVCWSGIHYRLFANKIRRLINSSFRHPQRWLQKLGRHSCKTRSNSSISSA